MPNDLTDIKPDTIQMCLDAKAMTAVQTEVDKWLPAEKEHVTVYGNVIFMPADPLGTMDEKRLKLLDLVDVNAESMTSWVRTRFNGTQFAFIVGQLHKPVEDEK